jgi:nitrite reductase (NADH) small subunit
MAWQELIHAERCPPGNSCEVVVGEHVVALFNVEGSFYALDGICPHQGGPLGEGELAGCIVTCPWHGWQFDVQTGQQQLNKNLLQPRFETKVEDGAVWGNLPE